MSALYTIKEEIAALQSMETDGDLSLEEAIHNSLDDLNIEFNEKIDNIVKLNQSIENDVLLINAEIKRLTDRKNKFNDRIDSMKKYILKNMDELNKKSVKTPLFSVTSVKGRDKLIIDNESEIPSDYISIKVIESPDKKALLKAYKDGEIKGCHVEQSDNTLRIK